MGGTVTGEKLLEVKDLKKHFPIRGGFFGRVVGSVKAVDGVSFDVMKGETFSIVGESGCGKSTTGMTILRLLEPTGGQVLFEGKDMATAKGKELRRLRRDMQVIFQDPYSSLNPKHTVREIISEPLIVNKLASGKELEKRVHQLLEYVGLGPHHLERYPHEFSGGQRQRIGIARALALDPKLIICDEPVSALDVSIQSQVLNLLEELQQELGLTYIFISHDLSVVEHISDRVAVMYLGKIVEMGTREEIFESPKHPYTQALLSSVPLIDAQARKNKQRIILKGDVPSPMSPPKGCHFHTRCPFKMDRCVQEYPALRPASPTHEVACHLVEPAGEQKLA